MQRVYRFEVEGRSLTEDETRQWLAANGYGQNFANREAEAERAADSVGKMIRASVEAKQSMLKSWEDVEWMMRGNPLSLGDTWQADIHVPETKKCLYAMAPRIVQAVAGPGAELFHCVGRDQQDRDRALLIEEMLRFQMAQCRFGDNLERMVLCGLMYGGVGIRTGWKIRHRLQNITDIRQERDQGGEIQQVFTTRPDVPTMAYQGLDWHLIHPRDLIWDPAAVTGTDPLFAGEFMRAPLHELLAMEAQGTLEGVCDALEGKRDTKAKCLLQGEVYRYRQDIAKADAEGRALRPEELSSPRIEDTDVNRVPVVEVWGTWSHKEKPEQAHDWRAWQFCYVNDVPVRIAHNPYATQHIPIIFAPMTREPFSPWAISMAMDALPLQIAFDQTRALGQRSHELSVSPFWSADEGTDIPRSLSSMLPGERLTGQNIEIHKWPATISETIAATDMFRRDIREVTGVPEGFTGSDQSGTATQYEGNIQEANRRAQLYVYNVGDMVRNVVQHAFWYSQQFMTQSQEFRILGRGASRLGPYGRIDPEHLASPVDIEIVGLREFASHGLRSTRIASFVSQFAPFINAAVAAGKLDPVKFVEEGYLATMGFRLGDQIMRRDMDENDVMPPEQEEILLEQGQRVEVHPLDDDEQHLWTHAREYHEGESGGAKDSVQAERMLHMNKHVAALKKKQAQQQAQQQQMTMAQNQPMMLAGDGRNASGDGRYHQNQPDLTEGPAQTSPGEAPGPARPAAMAAPDRSQPVFSMAQ